MCRAGRKTLLTHSLPQTMSKAAFTFTFTWVRVRVSINTTQLKFIKKRLPEG